MPKNTANKIQINLLLRKNTETKILERKKKHSGMRNKHKTKP